MTLKLNGSTAGSVSIDAPADTSPTGTDVTLTLPTSAGSSGQYLQTNGSGTLSWQTVASDAISEGNTSVECVDTGSDGHITFDTEGSERGRFDSSGRLLVGTTSSVGSGSGQYAKLQVGPSTFGSTSGGKISIQRGQAASAISSGSEIGQLVFSDNAGGDYAFITVRSDAAGGSSDYPGRIEFSTTADGASSPTERMRITQAGRVGINCTPAGYSQFQVNGDSDTGFPITLHDTKTGTTNATIVYFLRNNASPGSISTTNTATSYNTSSDYRLKENIEPVSDGITRLQQLKPSRFNFIADPDKTVDGFIAHEVQTVVPEAITGEKDAVDDDGNPVYQGIDQSKLVPLLTAALQEAVQRIETLEAANASLEARLTALEGGAS